MKRTPLSDYIRLQAVMAMMEKDAGAGKFLRDLLMALKEMPSSSAEKAVIQQELSKHPEYRENFRKLEELAELIPTAKPLIQKMLASFSENRYSGLGDIGRAIKEKTKKLFQKKAPPEESPTESQKPAPAQKSNPKKEPVKPQDLFTGQKPSTKPPETSQQDATGLNDPANSKIKEFWTDKGLTINTISRSGSVVFMRGSLRRPMQMVTNGQKSEKNIWSLRLHPEGSMTLSVRASSPTPKKINLKASLADVMRELVARFDPTEKNILDTLKPLTKEKKPGTGERSFPALNNYINYMVDLQLKKEKAVGNPEDVVDAIEDGVVRKRVEMTGIKPTKVDQKGENYTINGKVFDDIDIIKKGKVVDPSIIHLWVADAGNVTAIMRFPDLDQMMEQKVEEKIEEKTGEPAQTKPGTPATPVKQKTPSKAPKKTPTKQKPMSEVIREQFPSGAHFSKKL